MGWLGKMVGGTIGFAIGGPLGAIAGAAFGHMYDAEPGAHEALPNASEMSGSSRAQFTFFVAAFSMLAKLVRVDGQITEAEIDSIHQFMVQDLKLNPASRQMADKIFKTALSAPQRFDEFALQFYRQFHGQPELLELMIDILVRVSVADGALDDREETLIRKAVSIFQISEDRYMNIKSRYVAATDSTYAVLGCSPTDSDEHIKKQFRKLAMEYHPDTIASKGLPDAFIQFANDKFREIHDAYEAICKERNM